MTVRRRPGIIHGLPRLEQVGGAAGHTFQNGQCSISLRERLRLGPEGGLGVVAPQELHDNREDLGLDVERKRRDDWLRGGDFLAPRWRHRHPSPIEERRDGLTPLTRCAHSQSITKRPWSATGPPRLHA